MIGLGRVIAGEYPRLRCKLVDLEPRAEDGGLEAASRRFLPPTPRTRWPCAEAFDTSTATCPPRACRRRTDVRGGATGGIAWHRGLPAHSTGWRFQTARRRPPGPGEVEIEVDAAGLNFSDVMKALGLYPGLPEGPVSLGAECSGRVTCAGAGGHGR